MIILGKMTLKEIVIYMHSILVVDDSSFMRTWLKRLLNNYGYDNVVEASNGFEAILQFRKIKPEIILLDIHMPGISGVEVLKRLLTIDPSVKVIICSAMSTTFLVQECLTIGAKDFVKKPHFEGLLKKIDQVLIDQ